MANLVKGLHHITLCASGAQEDVDFLTKVMGQRLIKQTVLFDGRYAHYHLYYSNANAEVGSVMTTFPYKRVPGRQGSGQIQASVYTIPSGSLSFWKDHLKRHNVDNSGVLEARNKEVRLRLLDGGRVEKERNKWQAINIIIPLGLLLVFASAYLFFRQRRYAG